MTATAGVFRVLLRAEIHPGMERYFERAWLEIGNWITAQPASLGQWLMRSDREQSVYYIMSDWVDEPQFRVFEKSLQYLEHTKKLQPFRTSGAMWTMTVVHSLEKTGTLT